MAQQTDISKMETTQTAVEFLLTELDIAKFIAREKLTMAAEVVRQSKQMEKEQMQQSIEIPTEEDIQNKIESLKGWVLIEKDFFERGASWMRNQIIYKNK